MSTMKREQLKQLLEQLFVLVSDMDVPVYRRKSVMWLRNHLAQRNAQHPNFQEAMNVIDTLINNGVTHG